MSSKHCLQPGPSVQVALRPVSLITLFISCTITVFVVAQACMHSLTITFVTQWITEFSILWTTILFMRLQRIAVLWTLGLSNNLFLGLPAGYLEDLKTGWNLFQLCKEWRCKKLRSSSSWSRQISWDIHFWWFMIPVCQY